MTPDPGAHPSGLRSPLDAMRADGLVPLFTSGDADSLYWVAKALVTAGITTLEVTLRAPGSLNALGRLITRGDAAGLSLMIGAGTVLDGTTAQAAIDAGARFVFSPILVPDVAHRCDEAGVPYIPGCATPAEIHAALKLGCTTVKLFPADAIGGPGFLRAVRAVFPELAAIPSGGVVPETAALRAWFDAGAVAVAMGSRLFPPQAVDAGDVRELQRQIESAVAAVSAARTATEA